MVPRWIGTVAGRLDLLPKGFPEITLPCTPLYCIGVFFAFYAIKVICLKEQLMATNGSVSG